MRLMVSWGVALLEVSIYLASPNDFIAAIAGFWFGLALVNTFNAINK